MHSAENYKNLMISVIFGSVMSAGIAPYVIIAMMADIGGGVGHMATVQLIIQAGGCASLPLAIIFEGISSKKASLLLFGFGRGFMIFLIIAPLLHLGPTAALVFFAAGTLCGCSAMGPANSWFKSLIPENSRGGFLGKRNALGLLICAALTPLIGLIIDHRAESGLKTEFFYPAIMLVPLLCGFLDLYFLGRTTENGSFDRRNNNNEKILKSFCSPGIWKAAVIPFLANAGAAMLAPFIIILYYNINMSSFTIGILIAASSLALAAGMVLSGRAADLSQKNIQKIFLLAPIHYAIWTCVCGVLTVFYFSGILSAGKTAAGVGACFCIMSFIQGLTQGVQTKYFLEVVDGGNISFSSAIFIQSLLSLLIIGISVKAGSWAADHNDMLRDMFYNGFNYIQIVFAYSIAFGISAAFFLSRTKICSIRETR